MALANLLRPAGRAAATSVLTALELVDRRVVGRLPSESVVRRAWAQSYGFLDHAVAAHVSHHSSATAEDDAPTQPQATASSHVDERQADHVDPTSEPESVEVHELTANLLTAQETAPLAGELAEDDDLREVQAALNAKRLVAEQHEQHPDT